MHLSLQTPAGRYECILVLHLLSSLEPPPSLSLSLTVHTLPHIVTPWYNLGNTNTVGDKASRAAECYGLLSSRAGSGSADCCTESPRMGATGDRQRPRLSHCLKSTKAGRRHRSCGTPNRMHSSRPRFTVRCAASQIEDARMYVREHQRAVVPG